MMAGRAFPGLLAPKGAFVRGYDCDAATQRGGAYGAWGRGDGGNLFSNDDNVRLLPVWLLARGGSCRLRWGFWRWRG